MKDNIVQMSDGTTYIVTRKGTYVKTVDKHGNRRNAAEVAKIVAANGGVDK